MKPTTQQQKKIKTIYLLSQFTHTKSIHELDHQEMNRIFGQRLKVELRYLISSGYLKVDNSVVQTLKRIQNTFLYDSPWQTKYLCVASTTFGESLKV